MRSQPKDPYEIEDEIRVNASSEAVMERILDSTTWPRWQSEIRSTSGPDRIEAGDEVSGDASLIGFHVEGVSRAVEVDGGNFVEDVIVGVRMRVRYRVERDGDETVIRRRIETRLPGGALGSLLTRVLKGKLRRMQKRLLEELADQASEGSA